MDPQPTLTTDRLSLRPPRLTDASDVQRLAGDRAVAATTLRIPHPYADGLAEEWLASQARAYEDGSAVTFAMTEGTQGQLVGVIGLVLEGPHERAEMGYWVGKPYWNRGYATEAARAVVEFGFEALGLERIHASHFTENPQSGSVLEKVGMLREGRLRRHIKKWDTFHDLECYAILRAEYEGSHKNENPV